MRFTGTKQFYKNNRFNFVMTLLSLVLCAILNIMLAFMLREFIEAVEFQDNDILKRGSYILVFYLVIYGLFSFTRRNYKNKYIKKALSQYKDYIFEKLLSKSISQFNNESSSKIISGFSNDLNSIEMNYLGGTLDLILTCLFYITASISTLCIYPKLALPLILASLICILLSMKYGQKLIEKEKETSEENRGFVSQVKDLLNGFIVIKSFKAEREVLDIFRKKNISLEETKEARRVTSDTVSIYGDISSIIVNVLIYGLGFYYAFQGDMSIGMVIAFIQLGDYILIPVRRLAPQLSERNAAKKLITRLSELVEQKEQNKEGIILESFEHQIELSDVSFSYEEENEVLQHVTMTFEKGKSYAIVGGSGSGKSTILKLLLRFHQQTSGEIKIDGNPISDVDLDSLYNQVSIIQQDVFLFDSTIKNNITMFQTYQADKVKAAIKQAGLSSLIADRGQDYLCGEGGCNLSGGEKQRVSIARCLVRETPVLLMDEATAALDNETALMVEHKILDIEGLTRIIVTHRFHESTLSKFDKIYVMNKGNVIEEGSFEELMQNQGYFYSLYRISQAEE